MTDKETTPQDPSSMPDATTDETAAERPLTLLERVQQARALQSANRPNPKGFYKGPKIGNGPRGSRRSMGKR